MLSGSLTVTGQLEGVQFEGVQKSTLTQAPQCLLRHFVIRLGNASKVLLDDRFRLGTSRHTETSCVTLQPSQYPKVYQHVSKDSHVRLQRNLHTKSMACEQLFIGTDVGVSNRANKLARRIPFRIHVHTLSLRQSWQ